MQKTLGMKFDSEKRRMGLLPPRALESVADVLTFGAKKYLPDNWKYVENGPQRYLDASLRHITAYMKGEQFDPETGHPHLSHALCCLMFIVDLDIEAEENQIAEAEEHDLNQYSHEALNAVLRAIIADNSVKDETENKPRPLGEIINDMIRKGQYENI